MNDRIKNIISSVGPLLGVIFLFIVVGNYGIGRVSSLRQEIAAAQNDKNTLTAKLNTLRSLSSTIGTGTENATIALPNENPAIAVLGQLKFLALQNAIPLSSVKSGIGTPDKSGLSSVSISFNVSGSREAIFAFLTGVENSAPISLIDKVKLTELGGQITAAVSVQSFWAPLPTKIPAVTEAVNDLTPAEKATLTIVTGLIQPPFAAEQPGTGTGGGKTNPFQ